MNTRIIDTADAVVRRYKTRNPEEIISRRAINLKEIRYCHDLLGYYTVLLNCEYIGINSNCTKAQRVSAMAHELGHALFDRKHASSGQTFQDTYFYSLDNSKTERRANTFAAELLLADDDVLEPIGYYEAVEPSLLLRYNRGKINKGVYLMPTKAQLEQWIPGALDNFKSVIPPIDVPYPPVYIVNSRNFAKIRKQLVSELGSKHTECPEIEIGEYLYGSHGGAIIINQTDIESNQRLEFCNAYWHELGHFYAISSQQPGLTRYSEPGLVDDSHNFNVDSGIPTLGLSDERIIQEGYWFWQEFIAQAIANTVRYHFYPTHQMNWHPENWYPISDFLAEMLKEALFHEAYSIDEYALSHYFAYLLLDDNAKWYAQAAKENKLLEYDDHGNIGIPDSPIDPTCISWVEPEDFQEPLLRMKSLIEKQLQKENFWDISKASLLEIGQCIADMMLIKFKAKINHMM